MSETVKWVVTQARNPFSHEKPSYSIFGGQHELSLLSKCMQSDLNEYNLQHIFVWLLMLAFNAITAPIK